MPWAAAVMGLCTGGRRFDTARCGRQSRVPPGDRHWQPARPVAHGPPSDPPHARRSASQTRGFRSPVAPFHRRCVRPPLPRAPAFSQPAGLPAVLPASLLPRRLRKQPKRPRRGSAEVSTASPSAGPAPLCNRDAGTGSRDRPSSLSRHSPPFLRSACPQSSEPSLARSLLALMKQRNSPLPRTCCPPVNTDRPHLQRATSPKHLDSQHVASRYSSAAARTPLLVRWLQFERAPPWKRAA